jgi:hypothetical protein
VRNADGLHRMNFWISVLAEVMTYICRAAFELRTVYLFVAVLLTMVNGIDPASHVAANNTFDLVFLV